MQSVKKAPAAKENTCMDHELSSDRLLFGTVACSGLQSSKGHHALSRHAVRTQEVFPTRSIQRTIGLHTALWEKSNDCLEVCIKECQIRMPK